MKTLIRVAAIWVIAFRSAMATPIAHRVETWMPEADDSGVRRGEVFFEQAGLLDHGRGRTERGAGWTGVLALPVLQAGRVAAVVAWYF